MHRSVNKVAALLAFEIGWMAISTASVAAMESVSAMLLRLIAWFIINLLLLVQARKTKIDWWEHNHAR